MQFQYRSLCIFITRFLSGLRGGLQMLLNSSWYMAGYSGKPCEIWYSRVLVVVICILWAAWTFWCLVSFWVIRFTCLNVGCNSKTVGVEQKNWESWVVVIFTCDVFDLLVFKLIWGPFGVLVSKWPVSQNSCPQSEISKIWDLGVKVDHSQC